METWQILFAIWLLITVWFIVQFSKDEVSDDAAVKAFGVNGAAIAIIIAAAIWPIMIPYAIFKVVFTR